MSVNCVRCICNKRTGADLLCDDCRLGPKCIWCGMSLSYHQGSLPEGLDMRMPCGGLKSGFTAKKITNETITLDDVKDGDA